MARGQAFFVVGHENWGKSKTLAALTDNSHQVRWRHVGDRRFFIRRMSNDDRPDEWTAFVRGLQPEHTPHVILTLCPKEAAFAELRGRDTSYAMFFWVLLHSHAGDRTITPSEIQSLRELGTVHEFTERAEAAQRAAAFEEFIRMHQ